VVASASIDFTRGVFRGGGISVAPSVARDDRKSRNLYTLRVFNAAIGGDPRQNFAKMFSNGTTTMIGLLYHVLKKV